MKRRFAVLCLLLMSFGTAGCLGQLFSDFDDFRRENSEAILTVGNTIGAKLTQMGQDRLTRGDALTGMLLILGGGAVGGGGYLVAKNGRPKPGS